MPGTPHPGHPSPSSNTSLSSAPLSSPAPSMVPRLSHSNSSYTSTVHEPQTRNPSPSPDRAVEQKEDDQDEDGILAIQPQGLGGTSGLKGMAAAAKLKRELGGLKDDLNVNGGIEESKEAEDHPLSEANLEARGYHSFICLGRPFHVEKRWKLVRELGQGAYGLVVSAQDDISGETIAIKMITRVFDKVILARRALREITLLRHFAAHENITGLIDLDVVHIGYNEIYLFMEPMEADLHQIIRSGQQLTNSHVQYFLYQLLRGMKYIHSANVLHRDLKPGNLLVNADCELKICDFGLARGFAANGLGEDGKPSQQVLTEYVATRWYRAPEIMLSFRKYTTGIDMWSIGCILAELMGQKPIFKGKDYVDQLNLILNILGTPSDDTLSRVGSDKAQAYIKNLPPSEGVPLAKLYPDAEPEALDLLSKLIAFDPTDRISVVEALAHPYLSSYHDEADEPSCPSTFDKWVEVEGLEDIEELRTAIYREVSEFRSEVREVDEHSWNDGSLAGDAMLISGETTEFRDSTSMSEFSQPEITNGGICDELRSYDGHFDPVTFSTDPRSRSKSPLAPSHHQRISSEETPHPPQHRPPRRPSSGFFDPFGRGRSAITAFTSQASPTTPQETPSGASSSEIVRPARSRTASASGDGMRPILRSLSTVSLSEAAGGYGGAATKGGFGMTAFSKVDPPPPLTVSDSDAPASELPLEFRSKRQTHVGEA